MSHSSDSSPTSPRTRLPLPALPSGTSPVESPTFPLAMNLLFDIVLLNKPHAVEVYVNGEIIAPMLHRTKHAEESYAYVKVEGAVQLLGLTKNFHPYLEDDFNKP
ncbi:hypothetical protein PENTCL1PPCAC_8585 [Pristionchus entomophagus]|uniref:Galectin n=1 Tax=Pristionchus entomophagus TaxID=358040 RepID=A0AAV5SUP2_9BILA|nr:hypothetical protein PENTCL1PPCAC_8585 [Pristionchus entomophagus]